MDDVFYWVETPKGIGVAISKNDDVVLVYFPKENNLHDGHFFKNKPPVRGKRCYAFYDTYVHGITKDKVV